MNGWFLTLIVIHVLSLGINLGKHGQKADVKYNFWGRLVGSAITLGLVYMAIKTGF